MISPTSVCISWDKRVTYLVEEFGLVFEIRFYLVLDPSSAETKLDIAKISTIETRYHANIGKFIEWTFIDQKKWISKHENIKLNGNTRKQRFDKNKQLTQLGA